MIQCIKDGIKGANVQFFGGLKKLLTVKENLKVIGGIVFMVAVMGLMMVGLINLITYVSTFPVFFLLLITGVASMVIVLFYIATIFLHCGIFPKRLL